MAGTFESDDCDAAAKTPTKKDDELTNFIDGKAPGDKKKQYILEERHKRLDDRRVMIVREVRPIEEVFDEEVAEKFAASRRKQSEVQDQAAKERLQKMYKKNLKSLKAPQVRSGRFAFGGKSVSKGADLDSSEMSSLFRSSLSSKKSSKPKSSSYTSQTDTSAFSDDLSVESSIRSHLPPAPKKAGKGKASKMKTSKSETSKISKSETSKISKSQSQPAEETVVASQSDVPLSSRRDTSLSASENSSSMSFAESVKQGDGGYKNSWASQVF